MKLIWHIIRKDIVRDRWALLLWAALFVAQVAIGCTLLRDLGDDRDWIDRLQIASGGLVVAQFLMGYILVARLVQADGLLGTDMFWVTRPIGRGRLLLAKTGAVLLVFGLLPVALLAPWWLWCGFGARDLCWTAVDTFGWQLLMIAPAFLMASLTNDLGRMLMWTVLLFVAVMMGIGGLAANLRGAIGSNEIGVTYTRVWLACVLIVLCCAGIAIHQYRTRHLARSIGLAMAGILVVCVAALFPQWNWADQLAGLTEPAPSPEAVVAVAGLKTEVGAGMPGDRIRKTGHEPSFVTEVYYTGLPEFATVISAESRQTWSWPDGLGIKRPSYIGSGPRQAEAYLRQAYALAQPPVDAETAAWNKAQREKLNERVKARAIARGEAEPAPGRKLFLVPPSRPGYRQLIYSNVPEAMIARMRTDPPAYAARLPAALVRPAIVAELPLQAGASGGGDSTKAHVQWVGSNWVTNPPNGEHAGRGASLLITAPLLRRNGLWFAATVGADIRNLLSNDIYLVNRTTGDLARAIGYSVRGSRPVIVAGVVLQWNDLGVIPGWVVRNGEWVLRDPQWQEHTSVVLVTQQIAARFTADLKTDRLEFKPSMWQERDETAPAAKN